MATNALNQFKKEGFFIAKSLIGAGEVIAARESLHKTVSDQLKCIGETPRSDIFSSLQTLHKSDPDRYRRLAGALWRKLEVFELLHHQKIINFLKEEFGWNDIFVPGGQVIHIMADELKIQDGYFGLVPHQDFPSVQGSLNGVVVWMPLVDVDRNNYPLEVIPRSHVSGLLPAIENSDSTWETDTSRYQESDYLPVEVNVGDVVFMSLFTIHRSSKHGERGRLRLAASTRFDNAEEPSFVDRCYPTAYVRTVHREQYFKDFPTVEQVEKIFK